MSRRTWTLYRPLLWATLLLAVVQGRSLAQPPGPCSPSSTRAGFGTHPSIACPVLPDAPYIAVPVNAPLQATTYEDWAWKSFVAVNWPAITTPTPPPRGVPDLTKAFATAANDTPGVWETWKEKRELFIQGGVPNKDWNAPINYPGNANIPVCPGEEAAVAALGTSHRLFAQAGKALSLDESLQVPSESGPQTTVAGKAVQPQVWHGVRTASGENSVLYEVKFNYDYFTYVVGGDTPLYLDTNKNARRMNSGDHKYPNHSGPGGQGVNAISLPWRDQYDVAACAAKPSPEGPACATTGAVQAKAAWRRITETEKSQFHWTSGLCYRNTGGDKVCRAVANFGLIGFHIIQKTVYQGHYIYATWEHKSVSTDLYTYAEKPVTPKGAPAQPMAPAFPGSIKVSRDHAILPSTRLITDRYHALIKAANPTSVWLKYQLIGVQYLPVGCWGRNNRPCAPTGFQVGLEDPTNNGQPFYLANLVIETNWGLQNFQGVPPGPPGPYSPVKGFLTSPNSKPTDHFFPNTRPPGEFDRSLGNVGQSRRNRGQVFNMGGCMGYHGVAMALGTDFSFALFFGQQGAGAEAANGEQALGPPSFGNDVSIQNAANRFGPNQFLGVSAQNDVVATSGPAQQQFVLIDPKNPGSLAPLTNGSNVAVQSTTLGGYLLATTVVGYRPPPPNQAKIWYKVQLAPTFSDRAAQWTIRTVAPGTGPLKPGDQFCLVNNKPGLGNKTVFLSRYPVPDKVGVIDSCDPAATSSEPWTLQQPFAPPK